MEEGDQFPLLSDPPPYCELDERRMMSQTLTIMSALIKSQEGRRISEESDSLIFYKSVAKLSRIGGDACMRVPSFYSDEYLSHVDENVSIHLASRGHESDIPVDSSVDMEAELRNVWFPAYWAVILEDVPVEMVMDVLHRHQETLTKGISTEGATIGHYAAATPQNGVALLEAISAHCPDMLHLRDANGDYPLHFAARYSGDVEVLQYLIQQNPSATSAQGRDQQTPLSALVCRYEPKLEALLDCLVEADPQSLTIRDQYGSTPLYIACERCSLNTTLQIIPKLFPNDPSREALMLFRIPLHALFRRNNLNAPEMMIIVDKLIAHYEKTLSEVIFGYYFSIIDLDTGYDVLQILCARRENELAIRRVLEAYPAAVGANYLSDSALSLYLQNDSFMQAPHVPVLVYETVVDLLAAYQASTVAHVGWRDLELAVKHWPIDVIKIVHKTLLDVGQYQQLALSFFTSALKKRNDEIIRYVYQFCPVSLWTAFDIYDTPLCIAGMRCSFEIFTLIYESCADNFSCERYSIDSLIERMLLWGTSEEEEAEEAVGDNADKLRFLLRHYSRNTAPRHPLALEYAYMSVITSYRDSAYFCRLLLRAIPQAVFLSWRENAAELRKFNYMERRGAMYLLFSDAVLEQESREENSPMMLIWLRLRSHGDKSLMREVVSYL
jgi:hypothetical protein